MKKNQFSRSVKTFIFLGIVTISITIGCRKEAKQPVIDRFALVNRHNIINSQIDPLNSLSVGNGEFAFTADITGLQSFPEYHESGIPLGTQSQWGWHSFPNPKNYKPRDVYKKYKVGNDSVIYHYQFTEGTDQRKIEATNWLRENPHRLHLGLISLEILKNNSGRYKLSDIKEPKQELNLWTGELKSTFKIEEKTVEVRTYCHQDLDMISCQIKSSLLTEDKIKVKIRLPYARHEKFIAGYDFDTPDAYKTRIVHKSDTSVNFRSRLNNDEYYTKIQWKNQAELENHEQHVFCINPGDSSNIFEFSCLFTKDKITDELPEFVETVKNNKLRWKEFWTTGGAVDFSESSNPRALELERRVVLSQYLTKIQCSGSLPPQETGLTYNSWHGKFHLEMHWWHGVHFVYWNRPQYLEKQMDYYFHIYDEAEKLARLQGYKGVRWPKMVGPEGRDSPSSIGTFLIWQQPHVIYFSELLYQQQEKNDTILEKYKNLVFATAEFMASYARYDSLTQRYVLGPALIPAQERFKPEVTINPVFELNYWYWGLETAQKWRERTGLERDSIWQHVIDNLSDLPVQDSLYLFTESAPDSYTTPVFLTDHPIVLGVLGFIPETEKINRTIMQNTLLEVNKLWQWETIWGWDPPLAAMNACQLNKPQMAINFLLMDSPKNNYLINGHNYQRENLTLYLPGNGGLLTAIAMMCTYRDEEGNDGFPNDGTWNVKYENLFSME